jgi:hypothetical protein
MKGLVIVQKRKTLQLQPREKKILASFQWKLQQHM